MLRDTNKKNRKTTKFKFRGILRTHNSELLMKNIITIVFFVLIAALSFPQKIMSEPETPPQIEFDEMTHDFGFMTQGDRVKHSFKFYNRGSAPLTIGSIKTTCGCTAGIAKETNTAGGEENELEVEYDSRGKAGAFRKRVFVPSNDPVNPLVTLVVSGYVKISDHSDVTGTENLFKGECRKCHVLRGFKKKGRELYEMDCAMCHEHHVRHDRFIAHSAREMAKYPREHLYKATKEGVPGTSMPAYHTSAGGPLSEEEIEGLVDYMKSYEKPVTK